MALRKDARVASLALSPARVLIETSETIVGVQIAQINARHVKSGQLVEITFRYLPERIFPGKVEKGSANGRSGQTQVSGQAVTP